MDGAVLDLVSGWPGRWRHPELAVAVARPGGPADETAVARLLFAGLARPRDLEQSLTALLDGGHFAVVETFLLDALDDADPTAAGPRLVDIAQWRRTEDALAAARATAADQAAQRWRDLAARADAVDLAIADDPALSDVVERDAGDAAELLDERERAIAAAENGRVAAVSRELAARLATAGEGDPSREQWAESVRACLRAGEFRTAEEILEAGDDGVVEAGPLTVPPPPLFWPWRAASVSEVLEWYDRPDRSPGPAFRPYAAGARALTGLRDAVGALHRRVGPDTVTAFATALAETLGESAAPRTEEHAGAGFRTRLFGLRDARLPRLPLLDADGVTLWISAGDPDDPDPAPPPELSGPVVWFRPVTTAPQSDRPEVAVLDLSGLLRALADSGSRRTDTFGRRINLLRVLAPALDTSVLLGGSELHLGTGATRRDSLAWLFDLAGLRPDRPVLDGLLHDSGGHPVALRSLMAALFENVTAPGHEVRVTLADLRAVRTPEVRRRAGAELLAAVRSDPAARFVLFLALALFDRSARIGAADLLDSVGLLDLDPEVEGRLSRHVAVDRPLVSLARGGLLEDLGGGRFGLPAAGLLDLLRDDGPYDPRNMAVAAAVEVADIGRHADLAAAAVLSERITETIGHRVDNDVLSIRRLLDEAQERTRDPALRDVLDHLSTRVRALGGGTYRSAYRDALEPPRPVELRTLVRHVVGDVEWHLTHGVRVITNAEKQAEVWVLANPYTLQEAVRNILLNAARAAAVSDRTPRVVSVDLVGHPAPRLVGGVSIAAPCVAIEVADTGSGLDDDALARFVRSSAGWPGGLERPARGLGIALTMSWIREYGGAVDAIGRHDRYGGACVRIWLPAVQGPTSGGNS